MIRVFKSETIPDSLSKENCKKYDEQDIQKALLEDQHGKCYLCEQSTHKDFQIEHFKAQADFTDSKYNWSNLFLSCGFCNGRKSNKYSLLEPTSHNIEDHISHALDFANKKVVFAINSSPDEIDYALANDTIQLLNRLFNGKGNIRDVKAQTLYEDLQREINFFLSLLNEYGKNSNNENRQRIKDCLLISKEFLAFKYWILKGLPDFYAVFEQNVVWNKK
jgi:uncharacterized protein (TIGR02646 family)